MLSWNPYSIVIGLSLIIGPSFTGLSQVKSRKKVPLASCKTEVLQGVKGQIFEVSGNQMPAPGKGVQVRKGVQREFGIFLPTRLDLAVKGKEECFFTKTGTSLLKRAKSQKDGCFALSLKPGKYSILIREKGQWYANSFGGDGEIFQFEVFSDSVSSIDFRINHGAWY